MKKNKMQILDLESISILATTRVYPEITWQSDSEIIKPVVGTTQTTSLVCICEVKKEKSPESTSPSAQSSELILVFTQNFLTDGQGLP